MNVKNVRSKIGIFDSGLGGLIIAKAIFSKLPKYSYVYLGDTKNLPYGEKSAKQIYSYTRRAVEFLFKQDCQLVIVACNTASALALRKIQTDFQQKKYPGHRVLGVVVPTLESIFRQPSFGSQIRTNWKTKIGVIGTKATIASHIYKKELVKINRGSKIYELATPNLVPLIESNSLQKAKISLELYLRVFQKKGIESLVLGCTHYPILKTSAKRIIGKSVTVISQDEIIPAKLASYLTRHPEIAGQLSKNGERIFRVTDIKPDFQKVASRLIGKKIKLRLVKI